MAAGTVKSSTASTLANDSERIVGDDDAELAEPRQQAGILAERQRAFLLDGAGQRRSRPCACTARISSRPMRPAAPVTAIFSFVHVRVASCRSWRYSNARAGVQALVRRRSGYVQRQAKATFSSFAADLGEGAGDRPAAAAPVEVAGRRVVEQRPDDQAVELAHVERVAAALEQMLAEPQALIDADRDRARKSRPGTARAGARCRSVA